MDRKNRREIVEYLYDGGSIRHLSSSESKVLLAAMVLDRLGYTINSENIYLITRMNKQYIRNILKGLRDKGLLKGYEKNIYRLTLTKSDVGRVKSYKLGMSPKDIYKMSQDFQNFIRRLEEEELKASNEEEFLKKLDDLPNTKLGKLIIKRLKKREESLLSFL